MTRDLAGRVLAVLLALLPLAAGYLTNLVTSSFSWGLAVALGGLTVVIALLTWLAHGRGAGRRAGPRRGSSVRQVVSGGTIDGSRISTRGGADVVEKAGPGGSIEKSSISTRGGRIRRLARRGRIVNAEINDNG